jgi:hypothetical protein
MSDLARAVEGDVVTYKWQDGVNLLHAIWIFAAPWWFGFAENSSRWNHWTVGLIAGIVTVISLPRARVWKEAIIIAGGGWLFLSPWLFAFNDKPDARWDAWMLGALLIYVGSRALTDLVRLSHPPRR